MGHIRLGRLPRSRPWKAVVELMHSPALDAQELGAAAFAASTDALRGAKEDRGCSEPLRILSHLVLSARSPAAFDVALDDLGISAKARADGTRLLGEIAALAAEAKPTGSPSGILSNIADRAYRDVLLGSVRSEAEGLFGVTPESIRDALSELSTPAGYRELTREWFGRFIGRTLQAVIDRELSNVVGAGAIASSEAADALHEEVMAFAHERTAVLHDFAPSWLSKAIWQEGELRPVTFRRYFSYALEKVLRDVTQEGQNT